MPLCKEGFSILVQWRRRERTNYIKKRQKRLEKRWKKREPKCGLRGRVHVLASACVCEGEKVRIHNKCVVVGKKGGGKSTPSFKKKGMKRRVEKIKEVILTLNQTYTKIVTLVFSASALHSLVHPSSPIPSP